MTTHYDLISLGAGSGGLSIAERAAAYGAKVAVIENKELGGTCVNVGCVPKKVMWYAAGLAHSLPDAQDYGFDINLDGGSGKGTGKLNWEKLIAKRENYIGGILDWYDGYLGDAGVEVIEGSAKFLDNKTIEVVVDGEVETYTADNIVVATGGRPIDLTNIEGWDLGVNSDGFFQELDEVQPQKVVVVGGGYIALELAMLMDGLGSDVSVLHQGFPVLEGFDSTIQDALAAQMKADGLKRYHDEKISRIVEQGEGNPSQNNGKKVVTIEFEDGSKIEDVDALIWAIGRKPNTDNIGLENTDVEVSPRGTIVVDDYEKSSVDGIWAIGDVIGKAPLTPVAIAAGRRLGDRLYGGKPERKMSYNDIATVMFTHPPIGTIGMSEEKAREEFGDNDIKVYQTDFVPMYHTMTRHKVKTHMKLIVQGENEKIVGCHVIGTGADEMLQGFAVAIRMGATKSDFDDTVAIHPVSAEELVTMK